MGSLGWLRSLGVNLPPPSSPKAPRPVCNDCLFLLPRVHCIVVPSRNERALELGVQDQNIFHSDTAIS